LWEQAGMGSVPFGSRFMAANKGGCRAPVAAGGGPPHAAGFFSEKYHVQESCPQIAPLLSYWKP
jgi:hypothetical protein